jgi:cation diffusion facilitator family transporter
MSHSEHMPVSTDAKAAEEHTRRLRKVRAAKLSVASNTLLTLLKVLVGGWTGSVGILSEAMHSGTDLLASGIALYSVRASDTPPDDDHPYGHGKIESISGLAEAMLIFSAALFIGYEIIDKLRYPALRHSGSVDIGIGIMAISMVANFLISRYLNRRRSTPMLRTCRPMLLPRRGCLLAWCWCTLRTLPG